MSGIEIVRGGMDMTGKWVRDCWTVRLGGKPAARCRDLKSAKAFAVGSGYASGKWAIVHNRNGSIRAYIDAATGAET